MRRKKSNSGDVGICGAGVGHGEVVVLFLDACHRVWGDVRGYAWGPSDQRLVIPVANERERQSYAGALNGVTGDLIVIPIAAGNSEWTGLFVEYLRQQYAEQRLIICWDGAPYHRGIEMQAYLEALNHGLPRAAWPITCIQFAPYAPEQNPIEDVWLQAKTYVRQQWHRCHDTFASVTARFEEALDTLNFTVSGCKEYLPCLQLN